MIIVLKADARPDSPEVRRLIALAESYPEVRTEVHQIQGATRSLTEIYLLGSTGVIPTAPFEEFACVEKVVRITRALPRDRPPRGRARGGRLRVQRRPHQPGHLPSLPRSVRGRHAPEHRGDVRGAARSAGSSTTRAGAYKPRTSPYDFQGHGAECLPFVFELAGKYGIRIIAMEITHESHIEEIRKALAASGDATGVMLQIGTRNAQNFELLKAVGQQTELPGAVQARHGHHARGVAQRLRVRRLGGNRRICFCLRGMKTNLGDPHRNLVDFAHVPVVKRLTRLPVCDRSLALGRQPRAAPDGLLDIFHVTAQGVIAGANLVLVDFHPRPGEALCDGPQALLMAELPRLIEDARIVREAYEARVRRV